MKISMNREQWLKIGEKAGWITAKKKDTIEELKAIAKKIGIKDGYGDVWFDEKTKTVAYTAGDWWDDECDIYDEGFAISGVNEVKHEAEVGKGYWESQGYIKIWPLDK
jgi:hypothetical protein